MGRFGGRDLRYAQVGGVPAAVPAITVTTTQREMWPGYAVDLGEGFRVTKERNGQQLEAVCWLRTHQLGFEVVLNVNGNLQRSQVCRSTDEVLSLTETWKTALLGRGWEERRCLP